MVVSSAYVEACSGSVVVCGGLWRSVVVGGVESCGFDPLSGVFFFYSVI